MKTALRTANSDLGAAPPAPKLLPPAPDGVMTPRDWAILGKLYEGASVETIAASVGLTVEEVRMRQESPHFQAQCRKIEEGMVAKITAGDFGVAAYAKGEAIDAMKRIVGLAKNAGNEETKRKANLDVLAFAGVQPAKKIELVTPDKILEQMDAEELELFATQGLWPVRFAAQLERLAIRMEQGRAAARIASSSGVKGQTIPLLESEWEELEG